MDLREQKLFSDVVTLVNRTAFQLEFQYDSVVYVVKPRGWLLLPRHIARLALARHPIKIAGNGRVQVSALGIEEVTDCQPFEDTVDPTQVQTLDIIPGEVNGKPLTMRRVDLEPDADSPPQPRPRATTAAEP